MRIPFTDYEFTSRKAIKAEVADAVRREADARAARVLKRHARNPACLRAAVAAHCGVTNVRFVDVNSMLLEPMERAIVAFADAAVSARRLPVLDAHPKEPPQIALVRREFALAMLS